jgi:hypothetical protein
VIANGVFFTNAVKKAFGAAGMYQVMVPEVSKRFERLGITKLSERSMQWYLDSEEFGPDVSVTQLQ